MLQGVGKLDFVMEAKLPIISLPIAVPHCKNSAPVVLNLSPFLLPRAGAQNLFQH